MILNFTKVCVCVFFIQIIWHSPSGISLFPPLLSPGDGSAWRGCVTMPALEEVGCFWINQLLWDISHTHLPVQSGGPGPGWSIQELRHPPLPMQPPWVSRFFVLFHLVPCMSPSWLQAPTFILEGSRQLLPAWALQNKACALSFALPPDLHSLSKPLSTLIFTCSGLPHIATHCTFCLAVCLWGKIYWVCLSKLFNGLRCWKPIGIFCFLSCPIILWDCDLGYLA